MLYREIIAVCSQIHTTHKYTVWAERRISGVKPGGAHNNHSQWLLCAPTCFNTKMRCAHTVLCVVITTNSIIRLIFVMVMLYVCCGV